MALLTVLACVYAELPGYREKHPKSLFLIVLSEERLPILILLALIAAGFQVAPHVRISSSNRIRKSTKWYLEQIHRKNWPADGNRGLNGDFRVSLFVPHHEKVPFKNEKRHLFCVYRTIGGTPKCRWQIDDEGAPHGLVGFVFRHRVASPVRGLPKTASEEAVSRYIQQTHSSREEYDTRTWKGAAMYGSPVQVSADSTPIGVLLVECKTPEYSFGPSNFEFDAEICGKILKGLLTIEGGE